MYFFVVSLIFKNSGVLQISKECSQRIKSGACVEEFLKVDWIGAQNVDGIVFIRKGAGLGQEPLDR